MTEGLAMSGAPADEPLEQRIVAELPGLRAFVRRLSGVRRARGDAEDLVQEVLARALRYRASFDPERALGPWLRGMALRVLIDHGARVEPMAELAPDEGERARPTDSERVEQRETIAHALQRLSSIEREIVLRFHGRGETIREIARGLALPDGTVKSHLHRARRKLAEERE